MLFEYNEGNVRVVASLVDAKGHSKDLGRIVWAQVNDRPELLSTRFTPEAGSFNTPSPTWTKGRPEVGVV